MSGHKKKEDENNKLPERDQAFIDKVAADEKKWHEDYLDPMNVDVVDDQLVPAPKDHESPRE